MIRESVKSSIKYITDAFNGKFMHVLTTTIGGFLCFLPMMLDMHSNLENGLLVNALRSTEAKLSGVVSLTLCAPLAVDLVIDGFQNFILHSTSKIIRNHRKDAMNKNLVIDVVDRCEIMLVLLANLISYIILFLPDETKNIALLFICARRCYYTLIFGSLCCSMNRYSKKDFPCCTILFLIVICCTGSAAGVFANNLDPAGKGLIHNGSAIIFYIFLYTAYGSIFILSCRWLLRSTITGRRIIHFFKLISFRLLKMFSKKNDDTIVLADDDSSHDLIIVDPYLPFKIAYITSFIVLMIVTAILAYRYKILAGMDKNQLFASNMPGAFLLLAILAVNTQRVKYSAVSNLVRILLR